MRSFTASILILASILACEGPTGPQGPEGEGITQVIFETPITSEVIHSPPMETDGATPGIDCYVKPPTRPWWADVASYGAICAVNGGESGGASGWRGYAEVPEAWVDSGYLLRMIVSWAS